MLMNIIWKKQTLIRHLEIGGYCFPEVTKVQVFVNGLHPEFSIALSPLLLQTLEEAHTRAKAFELAHEYYSLHS
ncbi:29215_t:CDS:1, partial [Gigaspora margarita]